MDASLRFGGRHRARGAHRIHILKYHIRFRRHFHHDLLCIRPPTFIHVDDIGLPALWHRSSWHLEQIAGKEGSFIATGTRTDLQDGVFRIFRSFGSSGMRMRSSSSVCSVCK